MDELDVSSHKLPPQNVEAEQSVLGGILIENDAINKVLEILTPEDFYRDAHRKIYNALINLSVRDEPADLSTLTNELRKIDQLDGAGGASYIASLIDSVPTAANIEYYASIGTLRQLFYAIFLTDVVGLEPRLASFVALVGIMWDALNDPIIGTLTDRARTRWGRRRPFLLVFAIPYGASFLLFWWVPPIDNQVLLAIVVCFAFILADSLQTLVYVPFIFLLPEIAPDYDQRTELTGFRMFFNLLASLVNAVAAPAIVDSILASGGTQQQGYIVIASLFGGTAALPFLLIFAVIRERTRSAEEQKREQETPFMDGPPGAARDHCRVRGT